MSFSKLVDLLIRSRLDFILFSISFLAVALLIHGGLLRRYKTGLPRFIWALFIPSLLMGGVMMEYAGNLERMHLERMIEGLAPTYAHEMAQLGHSKIGLETPANDPFYLSLIQKQIGWYQLNPVINDIYTFRKLPDNRIVFIVDSETDYNHNGVYEGERESRTPIGEIFEDADYTAHAAFEGKSIFDPVPYTDRWGTWVSSYAPIYGPDGKVEAVLGVDYAAGSWVRAIFRQRAAVAIFDAFILLILVAWGMMVGFIKANERRFRSLVSNIPGAIYRYVSKPRPHFEFFSSRIKELTGSPAASFIDHPMDSYQAFIHAEDRSRVRETVAKAIKQKEAYSIEYRLQPGKGELRWVSERGRATYDARGRFLWMDAAIFDVSSRKQLEDQLLKSKKFESMGQLAGAIAHDFNNLFTVINSYADLGVQATSQNDEYHDYFKEILKAGTRAGSVSQRLLAYSGHQLISPKPVNITHLLASLKKPLGQLCPKNIQTSFYLAQDIWPTVIDERQFEQIIINLVTNACDAMPEGGSLKIETHNQILKRGDSAPDLPPEEYVQLIVEDQGCGMTEEMREHLFEPFYTTKGRNSSNGLGLATVYGITKQSKGWIQVTSEKEKGTRFEIYLPRAEQEAEKETTPLKRIETLSGNETILVVDDEDMVRELAAYILKQHGYKVWEARNGIDALAIASSHAHEKIHLLFTDIEMPQMEGYKLAEELKKIRKDTKVIYTSGYTEEEVRPSHRDFRAEFFFIQKPYLSQNLLIQIRQILDL